MSERFPAPFTNTTLMCFMASFECGSIALISKHDISAWSLSDPVRLIASLYAVCNMVPSAFSITLGMHAAGRISFFFSFYLLDEFS